MIHKSNLYQGKSPSPEREIFSTLLEHAAFRIESIRSWLKTPGEWYDQNEDEWVLLCEGEAVLEIAGETLDLTKGDHLLIPRRTLHRVVSTSPDACWIAVFSS